MPDEAGPVDEILIYLLQGFLIVLAQQDLGGEKGLGLKSGAATPQEHLCASEEVRAAAGSSLLAAHPLPQSAGERRPLDRLHVEVTAAWREEEKRKVTPQRHQSPNCVCVGGQSWVLTFLLPDSGVLAVGQRAGGAVAEPGQVVLIAAEALRLRPANDEGNAARRERAGSWGHPDSQICPPPEHISPRGHIP